MREASTSFARMVFSSADRLDRSAVISVGAKRAVLRASSDVAVESGMGGVDDDTGASWLPQAPSTRATATALHVSAGFMMYVIIYWSSGLRAHSVWGST